MRIKDYIKQVGTILDDRLIKDVEDIITVKEELDYILSMMYQDCEELSTEQDAMLEQHVC
jgi:hypothetical protein